MGERKVLNKYYPPDFNPAKIPRKKLKKQINIRTMLSMSIRCNLCGNYMGKNKKFNARKEDAGNKYLGSIQIYRFYIKCSLCCGEITVLTDPQNTDYMVELGAIRNFEPWREEEEEDEEGLRDPMKAQEKRAQDSKRDMDTDAALEEFMSINSKHSKVSIDAMLNMAAPEEETKLFEEDEALIKSKFRGFGEYVKRIDDDDDGHDDALSNNSSKKRKISGGFTCTDHLLSEVNILGSSKSKISSAASGGGKVILSHITVVKKKKPSGT